MKRFIVTLILTTVITGVLIYSMPKDFDSYVADISTHGTVSIYCRMSQLDGIDMGSGKIVSCSVDDFYQTLAQCKDVDGVSVTFDGTEADVSRIVDLLGLEVVSAYELDGLVVTCGKSAKLRKGVLIDGETVNVQIAFSNGVVTVGSPLILGSY